MAVFVIEFLIKFCKVLEGAIIIRCVLSWLRGIDNNNGFVKIIAAFTDPIIVPFNNMYKNSPLAGSMMIIDFSPIFAYTFVMYIETLGRTLLSVLEMM